MAAYDPDEEEPPLDPAAERLRRKLARLVMVSGGIMMLGLIAVFAAIVYKLNQPRSAALPVATSAPFAGATVDAKIALPAGAHVKGAALDGDHALVTLESGDGRESFLLVDLATGRILGRYTLQPE
jgi:hypothetical protein